MRIAVEFIAMERPRGAPGSLEIDDGATVTEALTRLPMAGSASYLTLVNSAPVPPGERPNVRLEDGDTLSLFRPLKGG